MASGTASLKLKEFEPLTKLLQMLPKRVHKTFMTYDAEWTCLDVKTQYIAVGTNVGIVFLIDRITQKIQKLICKGKNVPVSKVKMCHSVDYMVAIGTSDGHIYIFQLPSILPGRNKQLQLTEVSNLHHSSITALVWSHNSQKLFSGDEDGLINCTEFQYDKEFLATCKSYFILKEPNEIVQLDYSAKILLISTRWRTILYSTQEKRITQVGKKDRKSLGQYGAVFQPGAFYQPQDMTLFAARPGYRIWKASSQGEVQSTYMFKDIITETTDGLDILEDTVNLRDIQPHKVEDCQFGPLLIYQGVYLVTFHKSGLFVIDPGESKYIGYHTNIGPILDVSVNEDEIYLLRNGYGRRIIRISQTPYLVADSPIFESRKMFPGSHDYRNTDATATTKFLGAFKGVSEKIHGAIEGHAVPLKNADPPWGYAKGTENDLPSPADSAKESTPSSATTPDDNDCKSLMIENNESIVQSIPSSKEDDFTGSGFYRDIAPGGPVWEEPLEIHHPGAPPLILEALGVTDGSGSVVGTISQDELVNRWNSIKTDDAGDIVFAAPKPKKKIKKKAKDKDTGSIASSELQVSSATGSVSSRSSSPLLNSQNQNGDEEIKKQFVEENTTENVEHKTDKDAKSSDFEKCDEKSIDDNGEKTFDQEDYTSQKSQEEAEELRKRLESELTALPCLELHDCAIPEVKSEKDHDLTYHTVLGNNVIKNSQKQFKTEFKETGSNEGDSELKDSDSHALAIQYDQKLHPADNNEIVQNIPSNHPPCIELSSKVLHSESVEDPEKLLNYNVADNVTNIGKKIDSEESEKISILNKVKEELGTLSLKEDEDKCPAKPNKGASVKSDSLDSVEDIYSIYRTSSSSSKSSLGRARLESAEDKSIDDVLQDDANASSEQDVAASNEKEMSIEESGEVVKGTSVRPEGFMDTWTEFLVPGNVQCMCVTERHIWVVDKSDKVYWSFLSGPGIKWHKLESKAQRISVSPSGSIVWRVDNGTLYAGTKITTRAPAGLKWEDFVLKDVVSISVDDHMGWYVKTNGEVIMHKKLSRERPCFKPIKVPCESEVIQVTCRKNVVWAVTIDRDIIVRSGIKDDIEEGTFWSFLEGTGPGMLVSSCDLGSDNTAWVIDIVGRVWFTTDVTAESPQGSGQWWQLNYGLERDPRHPDSQEVSLAEYLMQDSSAFDTIKSIATNPKKLVKMVKHNDKGGLLATRCSGVWVCPAFKNSIHVCRGSMWGHNWEQLDLPGMVSSVYKWIHICASGLQEKTGLIWVQQPNGDLFCFNPNSRHQSSLKVIEVSPPEAGCGQPFKCLSVLPNVVWALMPNGKVYLRTDMRPSCPQGINWVILNMQQLGDVKILWLSAGSQNVWVLDTSGQIYLRIGVDPPSKQLLNPAWVPVEGTPHSLGARFTKIFTGSNDWMVWALDNNGNIYARKGITDSMPIGTHWVVINGPKAEYLCIGEKHVYGLTQQGEILVREGIEKKNLKGDFWNKIPGSLFTISVTKGNDELWGISKDCQLCHRFTYSLKRKQVLEKLQGEPLRGQDVEGGWELL